MLMMIVMLMMMVMVMMMDYDDDGDGLHSVRPDLMDNGLDAALRSQWSADHNITTDSNKTHRSERPQDWRCRWPTQTYSCQRE
jgi:hypothetical protein